MGSLLTSSSLLKRPALLLAWSKSGNGSAVFWHFALTKLSLLKYRALGFDSAIPCWVPQTSRWVHFAFEFYGFETYNVLINPNNPAAQTVLTTMVKSGDYFFFTINSNGTATAFRSEIGQADLTGLKTNLRRIRNSTTTDTQYRKALAMFEKNPQPAGTLLNWVCRDNVEYLDLTKDRLE